MPATSSPSGSSAAAAPSESFFSSSFLRLLGPRVQAHWPVASRAQVLPVRGMVVTAISASIICSTAAWRAARSASSTPHLKGKDHWARALLIRRDTTFRFNSAHVGWLEGRLYDLLDAAADTRLHNGNRPSDETLPPYERAALESIVPPLRRVLRLLGYDTETPDDHATVRPAARARSNRFYGITVKQLLDAGLVAAGETLASTNGVWPGIAVLLADGAVEWHGARYPTPSSAAVAVKG